MTVDDPDRHGLTVTAFPAAQLLPDLRRVLARLFLPGEGVSEANSRAADLVERVRSLSAAEAARAATRILERFADREDDLVSLLRSHAAAVGHDHDAPDAMEEDRILILGAALTAEYALEGAALCNPSVVPHPDQTGLLPGQLRVALALRAIGEGHISSIGFVSATIGPGSRWAFDERVLPVSTPTVSEGDWTKKHFKETLQGTERLNQLSHAVIRALPARFRAAEIEDAIRGLPIDLVQQPGTRLELDNIRAVAATTYHARFAETSLLSQRVLFPNAAEEANGMEDARFVLFTDDDGTVEYRATYTGYDGRSIEPRLIVSSDLEYFRIHRLSGNAAKNKGMALFPRRVGGDMLAVTRIDGERMSLSRSKDGFVWTVDTVLSAPRRLWEAVQTGNCGSPIETDRGWLVLTHGVGPMRRYCIGAMLLDLDHPAIVLASLTEPLIEPLGDHQDGYVPNVVYTCGAVVHEGTLWIPYGIGDIRIGVSSVVLEDLLDAMTPTMAALQVAGAPR